MALFIVALVISGVTAFPLLAELKLVVRLLGLEAASGPAGHTGLAFWMLTIRFGLEDMYRQNPWIAYGTDWLAFGHIVIALFFVRPLFCPEESRWTLSADPSAKFRSTGGSSIVRSVFLACCRFSIVCTF